MVRAEGMATGPANFGYKSVYEIDVFGKSKRIDIIPDTDKAPLIRLAFELFASGKYSVITLTEEMRKRRLRSKRGNLLTNSAMHFTITNPFYYGKMRTKEGLLPHRYEPIISEGLFFKVQKILNERQKCPTKLKAKEFVFRGLIKCAVSDCGCLYSGERKKEKFVYYSCTNAKRICKRIYMTEKKLLEPIYETLDKMKLSEEKANELVDALKKNLNAKSLYQKNETARLRRQYDKLQNKIDGLTGKYAVNEIPKDVYERVLGSTKQEQREIEDELSRHTNADENYHITATRVIDMARRAREIFENSEISEKNEFLRFMFQNLRADGKNLTFTIKSPFKEFVYMSEHPIQLRD